MKKILSAALAILMVVTFAACDNGIDNGKEPPFKEDPRLTWANFLNLVDESKEWEAEGRLNFTMMTFQQYDAFGKACTDDTTIPWKNPFSGGLEGRGYFQMQKMEGINVELVLWQDIAGTWYVSYSVDGPLYKLKNGDDPSNEKAISVRTPDFATADEFMAHFEKDN